MRDDQRQRIFMLGTDVDEVDVKPVDSSVEVRHGVEPLLDLPPVVIGLPVVQNLLDGLERHTLRIVTDSLLLRQTGVGQAAAQIGERGLWNVNAERTDGIARWLSFGRWPAAIMPMSLSVWLVIRALLRLMVCSAACMLDNSYACETENRSLCIVNLIIRRSHSVKPVAMATAKSRAKDRLSFGPFDLLVDERLLTTRGTPVNLGARTLDILIVLRDPVARVSEAGMPMETRPWA